MTLASIEHDLITDIIPQRAPFLFVDTILENQPGERTQASYFVDPDASFFKGHFPGQPVLPGVLITEHMAQVACYCLGTWLQKSDTQYLLVRIEKAQFKAKVQPSDTLSTQVEATRRFDALAMFHCKTYCGEVLVAEADLLVSFKSPEAEL